MATGNLNFTRVTVPEGYEEYESSNYLYGEKQGGVQVLPSRVLLMYLQASDKPLTSAELWELCQGFGATPETGMIWCKTQMKHILSNMRKQRCIKMVKSDQKLKGSKLFRMMYSVGDIAPTLNQLKTAS